MFEKVAVWFAETFTILQLVGILIGLLLLTIGLALHILDALF